MHGRKQPSVLRFLGPIFKVSAPAAILFFAIEVSTSCPRVSESPKELCGASVPEWIYLALMTAAFFGIVCSVYLAYRDFIKGQYYIDLDL